MLPETSAPPPPKPVTPPPAESHPVAGGSGWFWRTLVATSTGCALPVMALAGLMFACALSFQILALGASTPTNTRSRGPASGPAIALIRVEGAISSGRAGAFDTNVAASETLIEQFEQAQADTEVKAILLSVNSPGGGANASDVIYHALKQVDKPVVVMMGDMAASGGYYVSMASDWIVANPSSLVGSIGVISEFPNAAGLFDKVGVDFVVITSGPRKDIGSPYREMTAAEKEYWQTIVDEIYANFVEVVAEGRHLSVAEVKPLADGGIFTGEQALAAGLVDQVGYEADAIAKAADLGGITGEPRIIEYETPTNIMDLLSQAAAQRSGLDLNSLLTDLTLPSLSMKWLGQ